MQDASSRRGFLRWGACAAAGAVAESKLKIVSVKAATLSLLPTSRFGTARFSSDFDPARKRWFGPFSQLAGSIMVQIRTAEGITGYGLGGGGGAAVYIIEHHLRDFLLGVNPLNIELLWEQMFASTSFYGRRGVVIMAMSGIDLALWDIRGQHAGLPVYRLLGGQPKTRVPAYLTSGDFELGLKLGFRAFKIPINTGPEEGEDGKRRTVKLLSEARQAVGREALLMIDCLARWDVPYTLDMAERLAGLRLHWIEEPLYPDDLGGYERLCREVKGTKIASGEHEYTRHGFRELVRHRASHILQPDLTWCGGMTEGREVAAMAAAHGIPVVPHRGGSLYGVHLVVASANCPLAESFGTGEAGNEMMELMTPRFENGDYHPPDKPGFGIEITDAVRKKYAPALL